MNLNDWLNRGWLIQHRPDRQEIRERLDIADRDIADSQVKGTSADTRLSIAYNAALQLAIAALRQLMATGWDMRRTTIAPSTHWLLPLAQTLT